MNKAQAAIIEFRYDIINVMKGALKEKPEGLNVEDVMTLLRLKYGDDVGGPSKVGNNFRALHDAGVLEVMKSKRGVTWWGLTGEDYTPELTQKILVNFPQELHDILKECAVGQERSKTSLILEYIERGLRTDKGLKASEPLY